MSVANKKIKTKIYLQISGGHFETKFISRTANDRDEIDFSGLEKSVSIHQDLLSLVIKRYISMVVKKENNTYKRKLINVFDFLYNGGSLNSTDQKLIYLNYILEELKDKDKKTV
jgi:hypothetical protein